MFRPLMAYKAPVYGSQIIVADRRYPSTQRCSQCGNIRAGEDKIELGVSVYCCVQCGHRDDRDHNAALNLEQYPRLEGNERLERPWMIVPLPALCKQNWQA